MCCDCTQHCHTCVCLSVAGCNFVLFAHCHSVTNLDKRLPVIHECPLEHARLGPAEAHEARHIPYNTAQQRECVSASACVSACACACVRDKAAEEIPLLRLMSPKGQTGQRERTV